MTQALPKNWLCRDNGYLVLQLPKEMFARLPETIILGATTFHKKSEFHVTLGTIPGIAEAASVTPEMAVEAFCSYPEAEQVQFVRFLDDIRHASQPGRESIAIRCEVANLEGLFEHLRTTLVMAGLLTQPAHVSLYTLDGAQGVGISTLAEMERFPKVVVPEIAAAL